ncbi:MAG: hypothetical protein ACRDRX_08885 [Pseudonocardiaceae bacterium]
MTPVLLIGLTVLLIFLLGFLAGLGVQTRAAAARATRQAAQQRELNEMRCFLRARQGGPNALRHAAATQAAVPYAYVTDHEEID